MSNSLNPYRLDSGAKQAFVRWWQRISDDKAESWARADRASLKHAHDVLALTCTPAYQRVYQDMLAARGGVAWPAYQQDRIAAMVGLAAHVKKGNSPEPLSLPKAMSYRPEGVDRNPVSELRFLRLLDAPDIDALYLGLRRCLPLIKSQIDVALMADDLFEWGDWVKKRWAYDYRWPDKATA
ncbi:type I-E CRISPR-associated protein Cse2/CasB [Curvibacter sp. RS43]|uniref:type I-E CRISPR-associated protein Cse2/CasB n=1 Tax=Curvibacter microcysteis TaxID=3026419 RepID=UPI002360C33A|nr:type I-E CRISPR-associated protein Cse2/CasB [Curvibacter sp. RS43]MDD0811734.1 type I-E CRISPR-associated protein Cse2/CasB [Curvibacter sp. RS43]